MKFVIKPKHTFLAILFALLVIYSLYQARFLIVGPQIQITTPQNGETVSEALITIEGRAKNISWISLNGRQIFTDENGYWSERLIVSSGTSIMTVSARDRFGREEIKSIEIFLPYGDDPVEIEEVEEEDEAEEIN